MSLSFEREGCPYWSWWPHPWGCFTTGRTQSWATLSSWSWVGRKVELDDLCLSLLTSTLLGLWEAEAMLLNSDSTKVLFSTADYLFHSCYAQRLLTLRHLLLPPKNSIFPFSLTKFPHSPLLSGSIQPQNCYTKKIWPCCYKKYFADCTVTSYCCDMLCWTYRTFFFFSLEILGLKDSSSEKKVPLPALFKHIKKYFKIYGE